MYGKFQKRVRDDQYFKMKDQIAEEKKMFGDMMEVIPVDMYGNAVPEGIGAANQARNLKRIATDLEARVGC